MDFDNLIAGTPLKWTDPRLPAIRDAIAMALPYSDDITPVAGAGGIHPADLPWNKTGRQIWFRAFEEAAKQRQLPALIAAAEEASADVAARAAELRSTTPPMPTTAAAGPSPADYRGFSPGAKKERQIVAGKPTLLDVRFLEIGTERARAVCRIEATFQDAVSTGTGFRIGPDRVLTNHHVVFDEENGDQPARAVQTFWRYELDASGVPMQPIVVTGKATQLVGDRAADWAVISFDEQLPGDATILSIAGPSEPVRVDDRVIVVQHPKGLHKKVAFAHNLVRWVDDEVVQYWTDTEEGSSGSPVFNERWEVVALHHASVELGNLDEHGYRNQGRAIGPVASAINQRGGAP